MRIQKSISVLMNYFLVPVLILVTQSCSKTGISLGSTESITNSPYSAKPTYSELYKNIFESKYLSCHASGGTNFSSYEALMAGGSVMALNPNGSSLYKQVVAGLMPMGSPSLSLKDIEAISTWISQGVASDVAPEVLPAPPNSLTRVATSSSQIILSWKLPMQTLPQQKLIFIVFT